MHEDWLNDPGSYEVTTGPKQKTTVDVDRFDYGDNGELKAIKDDKVVAVFKWWDSVVKKGD